MWGWCNIVCDGFGWGDFRGLGFGCIVVDVGRISRCGEGWAMYFQFRDFGEFGLRRLWLLARIAWRLRVLGFGIIDFW